MHSITLLIISFAILSNAFPQVSPKAPSQRKGGKGGRPKGGQPKGGLGGLLGGTPPGADGPDLRGLAQFLKTPSIPKLLASFGIKGLDPLWQVPGIQEYAPFYLDFRNISQLPFVVKMPMGPAPTGCSPYEMLIGRFRFIFRFNKHISFRHANQSIANFSSRNWRGWRLWIYCWRSSSEKG
jgi:hypothetical protein